MPTTGQQVWKTYVIPEMPQADAQEFGRRSVDRLRAGAAVWNSPTIDPKAHALYVGTGDAFTEPAAKTSDAVVALDLTTGNILWSFQAVENDAWMVGCVPVSSDNCPKDLGVDWDFGSSPVLIRNAQGKRILLATPKSGTVFALDPDRKGAVVWRLNLSESPAPNNGEIAFGGQHGFEARISRARERQFCRHRPCDWASRAWTTRLESLDNLGQPTINGENRTKAGLALRPIRGRDGNSGRRLYRRLGRHSACAFNRRRQSSLAI